MDDERKRKRTRLVRNTIKLSDVVRKSVVSSATVGCTFLHKLECLLCCANSGHCENWPECVTTKLVCVHVFLIEMVNL